HDPLELQAIDRQLESLHQDRVVLVHVCDKSLATQMMKTMNISISVNVADLAPSCVEYTSRGVQGAAPLGVQGASAQRSDRVAQSLTHVFVDRAVRRLLEVIDVRYRIMNDEERLAYILSDSSNESLGPKAQEHIQTTGCAARSQMLKMHIRAHLTSMHVMGD